MPGAEGQLSPPIQCMLHRGRSRILKGGGGGVLFIVVVSWPQPATPTFYCYLGQRGGSSEQLKNPPRSASVTHACSVQATPLEGIMLPE